MKKATSDQTRDDPRIARTRQAVFETALRLASTRGFSATTINEISEQSGVSKSTIYRHWDDVEEVFLDALSNYSRSYPVPDTGNLRDDLIVYMIDYARSLTDTLNGGLYAHLASAAVSDERFAAIQRDTATANRETGRPIYERALQRGELPPDTDLDALHELVSAPVPFRFLVSRRPLNAQWVTKHVDHVLTLVGYAPPT
ncbi:MAG: TetR/AcrR family transcriptional regulator [Actinomycetota bacterium]